MLWHNLKTARGCPSPPPSPRAHPRLPIYLRLDILLLLRPPPPPSRKISSPRRHPRARTHARTKSTSSGLAFCSIESKLRFSPPPSPLFFDSTDRRPPSSIPTDRRRRLRRPLRRRRCLRRSPAAPRSVPGLPCRFGGRSGSVRARARPPAPCGEFSRAKSAADPTAHRSAPPVGGGGGSFRLWNTHLV